MRLEVVVQDAASVQRRHPAHDAAQLRTRARAWARAHHMSMRSCELEHAVRVCACARVRECACARVRMCASARVPMCACATVRECARARVRVCA